MSTHVATLDHVNIQTAQLEPMLTWYGAVLGLSTGPRPDFPFPGAWIYAGDRAVLHLVGMADAPPRGGARIEHFAFAGTDLAGFEASLRARGEPCQRVDLTSFKLIQIHLQDPDGSRLHVDFPADEQP